MDNKITIPIEISARHLHLSLNDLEKLFGENYQLTVLKELSQPGEYASNSVVDIKINDRIIQKVRVIGPTRKSTQVEISKTDALFLRVNAPIHLSGDITGSPGITIIGPQGTVNLPEGVIVAKRHLHASSEMAKMHSLIDGQTVSIKISGDRELTLHNVIVRVNESYKWHCHIDTDEANSAGVDNNNAIGELIK